VREIVKYTNYKRFGVKTRIIYNGQTVDPAQQQKQKPPQ